MQKIDSGNVQMQADDWNRLIASIPFPHVLQTHQWGQVKSRFGWEMDQRVWKEDKLVTAAALILKRKIIARGFTEPLNVLYVPKGPLLLDWSNTSNRRQVIQDLMSYAHDQRAIFIKIDPDVAVGYGSVDSQDAIDDPVGHDVNRDLASMGWRFSKEQIQFRNTMKIDLTPSLETLMNAMKSKARYNVHLAERKGVVIRAGNIQDLPLLYKMYAETSVRDKFVIRNEAYYRMNWSIFLESGLAEILIAEVDGEPVAGLILYIFDKCAWFLFGMSTNLHREKMPNYLLQWRAICLARERGCQEYDLWGAPDMFSEDDPMYGVYRFKEGLGATVVRHIGAWDYVARPFYYYLYTQLFPRILDIMRYRGKKRTRNLVAPG